MVKKKMAVVVLKAVVVSSATDSTGWRRLESQAQRGHAVQEGGLVMVAGLALAAGAGV